MVSKNMVVIQQIKVEAPLGNWDINMPDFDGCAKM